MMKKRVWMLLAAAMLMMLLAGAAAAEPAQRYLDFTIFCGQGETTMPDYPDMAGMIGEGLTDDDFIITYSTSSQYTFLEDGRITISEDGIGNFYVYITYTPRVEGVGKPTRFQMMVSVLRPLTYIEPDVDHIVTNLDYSYASVELSVPNYVREDWIADVTYDSSIINVSHRTDVWQNKVLSISILGAGETDIVVTAYNGRQVVIPVTVYPAPTKVSFAQSHFQAKMGDTVDLGLDLGNGSIEPMPTIKVKVYGGTYAGNVEYSDRHYFPGDASHFNACQPGLHEIDVSTLGGLTGRVTVYVTGNENCARMAAETDMIYVRNTVTIKQFDAAGKQVYVPLKITAGADKAKLVGDRLTAAAAGEVEVTAENPDGTKVTLTLKIDVTPNEMYLEETEVTLEIGETYEPKVIFDQGSLPCRLVLNGQDMTDQILYTTRYEGMKIIAQAPGTAVYTVWAGDLSQQITITVPDSDKAVRIVKPAEPFPAKHSCQLYVQDKAGRVYPATFTSNTPDYYGEISPAGYFTSNLPGTTYFSVSARLEDGRYLSTTLHIETIPEWIKRDAIIVRKSGYSSVSVDSDVGPISSRELTFEVADEKVLTIEDGVIKPKKTGKTTVTVTSIYNPQATTTFTVEVISDTSTIYIGTTSIDVPYGSVRYMPTVYNEKGKEVTMVWQITHDNPGEGNPEKSGFLLEDGMIGCIWPTASCEVTGTVKGGSQKVKVNVRGYLLPETIAIEPLQVWLEPGESQTLTLTTEDENGGWGISYWEASDPGIVIFEEYSEGSGNVIKAVSGGTTLVAAMLENGAVAMCIVNVYDPDARLPGDVNEDGAVDAKDALIIMQYDAGWPVLINGWQGDVNADGQTNLADAQLIFQYSAGFDVQLKQYIPEN